MSVLGKVSAANQEQRINELLKIIKQKDQFIQSLLQRLNKNEKHMITVLSQFQNKTQAVPHKIYQHYLHNKSQKDHFLMLKINQSSLKQRLPIQLSHNLQLNLWNEQFFIQKTNKIEENQNEFKSNLKNDVSQLKKNLQKCQTIILSLKEIKQQQKLTKKQQQPINNNNLQNKLKLYIEKLQAQIFKDKQQIKGLRNYKFQLIKKIDDLQNNQKQQCQRIENLIIAKNQILSNRQEISDPAIKRRHKKILVNY